MSDIDVAVDGLRLRAGGRAGGRVLFDKLSFWVRAGERWVVLGCNGAGKSSLLAALAGIHPIDAGEVRLQGRPLGAWRRSELAAWRAWSPQFWSDPFAATVVETATIARDRSAWWAAAPGEHPDAEAARILERLDLAALADVDVRRLSGGERQRVALATTLLQAAPLLLLDEPSSHLDLAHQRLLLDVLTRHAAGGGALVVSLHDIQLASELATHAVLLGATGAAVAGPSDEVLTASALSHVFRVPVERALFRGRPRFIVG